MAIDRAEVLKRIDPPKTVVTMGRRMWNATHALVARDSDNDSLGNGSCFVVSYDRYDLAKKRCYVVTATHNLHGAINRGVHHVEMVVRCMDNAIQPAPQVWRTQAVRIPNDSWTHGGVDVSVAPLPLDDLPPDLYMESVGREDFQDRKNVQVYSAADIDLYGRWGVRDGQGQVILRRGILASFERPQIRLEVTPNTLTYAPVFLIDANVSKGMSGGIAVINVGEGLLEQSVLGLIHGTQRLLEDDLRDSPVENEEKRIRERLVKEMEIINGRIVFVVPYEQVADVLDDVHSRAAQA